jgi:DNA-binding MarR family transcriptional regulator
MGESHDILGEALYALAAQVVRDRDRELSLTAMSTLSTMERTGPRRLTDLAWNEGVTQPSMTAVVSQLEGLGLAQRRRDPGDGRVVLVSITRAGRHHLRTMRRHGASVVTTLIEKLSAPDVRSLDAALPALRHLLELSTEGPKVSNKKSASVEVRT